jgi:hypothetical protein
MRPHDSKSRNHHYRSCQSVLGLLPHSPMNIAALTVNMMLNITGRWLEDAAFRDRLIAAGPLGAGILEQLEQSHKPLAKIKHNRNSAHARIRDLIDQITQVDLMHDRKARSLHQHLNGLIEAADDDGEIAQYRGLQSLLFADGLRVVRLPYIEEGGAAVALDQAVGPEQRAQLAAIKVGPRTLEDIFVAWMSAGHKLGELVRQRAELKASLGREGSAIEGIDIRAGRQQWLQAVRGLLWAIEVKPTLHTLAEPVEASLNEGIAISLRRRELGSDAAVEEDDAAGDDEVTEDDDEVTEDDEPSDESADEQSALAVGS